MEYQRSDDPSLRGQFPFYMQDGLAKPFASYLDAAKQAVVSTVEQYKTIYGKSTVDQRLLIGEEYQY